MTKYSCFHGDDRRNESEVEIDILFEKVNDSKLLIS